MGVIAPGGVNVDTVTFRVTLDGTPLDDFVLRAGQPPYPLYSSTPRLAGPVGLGPSGVTGQVGVSQGNFEVWIKDAPIGNWSVTCMAWTKADFTSGKPPTYPAKGPYTGHVDAGRTDQPTVTYNFYFKFEQSFSGGGASSYGVVPDLGVDVQGGY
jgi:hypothetical protein